MVLTQVHWLHPRLDWEQLFKCIRSEKELDALPSGVRLRKTPSEDKPEYSFGVPLGEKVLVKGPVISSEANNDTLYLELADGSGFVPIDLGLGPHFEVGQSAPFSNRGYKQPRDAPCQRKSELFAHQTLLAYSFSISLIRR